MYECMHVCNEGHNYDNTYVEAYKKYYIYIYIYVQTESTPPSRWLPGPLQCFCGSRTLSLRPPFPPCPPSPLSRPPLSLRGPPPRRVVAPARRAVVEQAQDIPADHRNRARCDLPIQRPSKPCSTPSTLRYSCEPNSLACCGILSRPS